MQQRPTLTLPAAIFPAVEWGVFTGLIRHQGTIAARQDSQLQIRCLSLLPKLQAGDSIAVNGVCLTAATLTSDGFKADLLANTLKGTTLGKLLLGTKLNLEAALEVGEALGGHFVQGHVDGTVKMLSRAQLSGGDWKLVFELPAWLAAWVIDRGSITVDGVSLTVQERGPGDFTVAVISTTWGNTSLSELKPGQSVNIEADLIVKSVYHILNAMKHPEQPLTLESLQRLGYSR